MTQDRMNGIIIGILYIVAAVSSVIAVVLYQPVLSDQWYLSVANGFETKVLIGVLNDLLLVVCGCWDSSHAVSLSSSLE